MQCEYNGSKCSYLHTQRVSVDGICIVREILVEILACHIITSVALIRKQFSSQNEENVVQI